MPTNDPFADLSTDTGATAPVTSNDPFADLSGGFDPGTGAPVAKPSLGQKIKAVVKVAPEIAKQLAVGTVPFAIPAAAEAAVHAIPALGVAAASRIPGAGQAGFLAGTAAKAVEDQATISALSKTRDSIAPVDLEATTKRFYDALLPGLEVKGWTPEHVMVEARQRARNVMLGAQATKESIDQQVEQTQRDVLNLPGEAVTNALFLGITPKVLGAMGSGILKVAGASAEKAAIKTVMAPASAVTTRIAGSMMRHGATGAVIGAAGIGSGRAVDRGVQAWADTKSTDEIVKEMVAGARQGGTEGAVIGGTLGAVLGPPLEAAGEAAVKRAAARNATLQAEARDLIERNATIVRLRNAAIDQTASSYDPHQQRMPLNADPVQTATTIIQQVHGEDAAMSEAGLRAASKLSDRLRLYQDANTVLEGNITPNPTGIGEGVQPIGAPLTQEGGRAPQPNLPPAVQGPLGVEPTTVGQGAVPGEMPTGTTLPLAEQIVPPSEQSPTVPLTEGGSAPIGVTPASVQGPIGERPSPFVPPSGTPMSTDLVSGRTAAPVVSPKPMPTVEGKDLVEHAINDAIASGDHGKALKMVEKYGLPMPRGLARAAVNDLIAEGDHAGALKLAEKTGLRTAPESKTAEGVKPKVSTPEVSTTAKPAEVPVPKPVANVGTYAQVSTSTDPFAALAAEKAPEPTAMSVSPDRVVEAVKSLSSETHATVTPTEDGRGLKVQLGVKPGEVAKPGGPATALDKIVQHADQNGLRVETDLIPTAAPKGGKIPLEKLIPWYEARGFKLVDSTRIPEGNLATAKLVREPIGSHQNAVATSLEKVAKDADMRLTKKLGRMNSGFDVTMVGDAGLRLAADMFSRSLRNGDELSSRLVQLYGDSVKPFVDKIVAAAQKHFVRMFGTEGNANDKLKELLDLHASGAHGMNWYENTADWAKKQFGQDSDMMLRFLAVTSANGQTESGAALALKAFAQWKSGMPFTGFRGDAMVGQLEKAIKGDNFGETTKIQNFYDALRGNPDAVVLDRWMMDAMGLKEKSGSLRPNDYKVYEQFVKDLSRENGMTPRQFQAAVWEGARIRKAHGSEASAGRVLSSKIGSARPLEELVTRKLGGLTPEQYIADTRGHLGMMQNLYQALEPIRRGVEPQGNGTFTAVEGAPSGHTFDPETFKAAGHEGHVVSMVSNLPVREHLYPARILKFRDDVQPLIDELKQRGYKPTIGVWRDTNPDGTPSGKFSIDLNVMVKDRQQALALGKLSRNKEIASLGKGGAWKENIPTGYDPSVNGKQFLPPKEWKAREAWHKQQMNRARVFLNTSEKVGVTTDKESESISNALVKLGGKEVNPKELTGNPGSMRTASFWVTPEGKTILINDMHGRNAKTVLKKLSIPVDKGYEGEFHGAGSEAQTLMNRGFIRGQASGSMIAFDLSRGITDGQRNALKQAISTHEDWAAALGNSKGELVKGFSSGKGDKAHHFLAAATQHE